MCCVILVVYKDCLYFSWYLHVLLISSRHRGDTPVEEGCWVSLWKKDRNVFSGLLERMGERKTILVFLIVFISILLLWKDTMTMTTLIIKKKHFIGLVYRFRALVHCHGRKLRILYLDLDPYVATKDRQWPRLKHLKHQSPRPVSHFPQQENTFSNKVTSTNLCQIAPHANDQALKYMSLWGHSFSNHHADLVILSDAKMPY